MSVILIATPSFALGQGITATIAIQGDIPPEGNGTFALFNTPVLNDGGQVAFGVTLINTADAPDDDYGIYRAEAMAGSLVNIDREFLSLLGIGVQNLDIIPAINNAGQVVTHRRAQSLLSGDHDQYRISDGSSATTIGLFGQDAPDGNGTFTDSLPPEPSLNDAGQVAFRADLSATDGGTSDDEGLFRASGGAVTQIVRKDQTAPNNDGNFSAFVTFIAPALNEVGEVAIFATLTNTVHDNGIFRGSGGAVTRIARKGQAAPDVVGTNGTFFFFGNPYALNDAGEAAFPAGLTGTSGMETDDFGIFRSSGGTLTQIVRRGQDAPDTSGTDGTFLTVSTPALNNAGQAAFSATLTGTSGMTNDDRGIFLGSGGPITQIVREGQGAPDGNGTFSSMNTPALNDAGQAAFYACLTGGMVGDHGIFLGDGQEIISAARAGQPLAGSTISVVRPFQGREFVSGRSSLNKFAQVAYEALLDNGKEGVFLFTPELHWRTAGSGDWDDRTNWTVSTQPAHVHPVLIDPDTASIVTGPSTATSVRSLVVGGGAGDATLHLDPLGPVDVSEDVMILPGGTLAGGGNLTAGTGISVGGTISPGASAASLSLLGDVAFAATGKLAVEIGGTIPAMEYDELTVNGMAGLGGMLEVSLVDLGTGLFAPSSGDSFTVLSSTDGITGAFDNVADGARLDTFDGVGSFLVSYDGVTNEVVLSNFLSTLAGDFDLDKDVDGFDFLKWQRGEVSNPPGASDLADWEANFGTVAPLSATSTAVPEPATGIILLFGMMSLHCRRDAVLS